MLLNFDIKVALGREFSKCLLLHALNDNLRRFVVVFVNETLDTLNLFFDSSSDEQLLVPPGHWNKCRDDARYTPSLFPHLSRQLCVPDLCKQFVLPVSCPCPAQRHREEIPTGILHPTSKCLSVVVLHLYRSNDANCTVT